MKLGANLITELEKTHFQRHGWVTVESRIDELRLLRCANKLRTMRARALASNYPFRRVWWDYIDSDNLAAVELPFNKSICDQEIYDFFSLIQLEKIVNKLMNWRDSYCSLARLFCMNSYNFRGNWHRDAPNLIRDSFALDSVQVAIYVQDQPGFRLLKKDYDVRVFQRKDIEKLFSDYYSCPLELPKESYYEVAGKAGTILLFNPSLFHQGSSFNERLDFHMRFLSKDQCPPKYPISYDDRLKFNAYDHLTVDFDLTKLSPNARIPQEGRSSTVKRFKNTLNYYTGVVNIVKWLRSYKAYSAIKRNLPIKVDMFANTVYQK